MLLNYHHLANYIYVYIRAFQVYMQYIASFKPYVSDSGVVTYMD